MTETTTARRWATSEVRFLDDERTPEESRAMALAHLREQIRAEGYVIEESTLEAAAAQRILVNEDRTGYDLVHDVTGSYNAYLIQWSVGARQRQKDGDLVLYPDLPDTTRDFRVPPEVTADGGGVRLVHGLDGPVTVRAWAESEPIGYVMAVALDDNQEQVEVVPGTTRLHVERDPDPEEQE